MQKAIAHGNASAHFAQSPTYPALHQITATRRALLVGAVSAIAAAAGGALAVVPASASIAERLERWRRLCIELDHAAAARELAHQEFVAEHGSSPNAHLPPPDADEEARLMADFVAWEARRVALAPIWQANEDRWLAAYEQHRVARLAAIESETANRMDAAAEAIIADPATDPETTAAKLEVALAIATPNGDDYLTEILGRILGMLRADGGAA